MENEPFTAPAPPPHQILGVPLAVWESLPPDRSLSYAIFTREDGSKRYKPVELTAGGKVIPLDSLPRLMT